MTEQLKIWALEELLDKELHRQKSIQTRHRIQERESEKQRIVDAVKRRGMPELVNPKTNITLLQHKYNPDRKLFPEKAWEKREQQGFRKLNDMEKTFLFLEYLIPYSIPILLVAIIALLDI
jgi:aryl-alcohol dehydrogenase-like predicted oxidoreductase